MTFHFHLADRVLNRPLLITPDKAQVILSVLANRIGVNTPDASRFIGDDVDYDENGRPKRDADGYAQRLPYRVTPEGVGIITVTGSLVNRGAWIGASSGLTSYEGIRHQLASLAASTAVRSVILDLHSPGGEAIGAFETAQAVRDLAAQKRVVAVVNGMAASAMYGIASGATEIVTTETGVSGSIGVVMLHADYSRHLANEGVTPTLIFAGAHKVDANPFEPLGDAVRADLQQEVESFYVAFLETVAKGRGQRLTADAARATEARTFIGARAVEVGLADRVGTFESVLADLSRASTRITVQKRSSSMDYNNGVPAAESAGVSKADHDAAVATARSEGEAAGAKAATERVSAILGAEGIKGDGKRMGAALDLAISSPAMASDAVVMFVTSNVAASTMPAAVAQAGSYDERRLAAAALAQPDAAAGKKPSGLSAGISAHAERVKRSA